MEELKFKISSALKDIIGRDLITDDNIAVFELVKNAYDAYATRVDITFENIYSDNSRIIIKDNGKGMSLEDIKNKWLFVAYSAKKEGTEDESFDYRDSIYQKRAFAGAKGIGRFSCDRLGRELLLESTKKGKDAKTEVIVTDWTLFEKDLKDEFIDITVAHETKAKNSYDLSHGTILEISDLRSEWDREKILRLKRSLAKLINPRKDKSSHNFKIFLNVPEELEKDKQKDDYNEIVNGEIQNLIFETLEIKTTKINTTISEDGRTIETELRDGGELVYKVKEKNAFKRLKDITATLFYLNRSAKLTFTNRMGLSSKDYGHVFVYKNGFRIYPYGESGEDPFKIDVRKAQGYGRFLGTRDLIGQIEILHDDEELRETTSRGDGFIKTNSYEQFEEFFWDSLKKLEKYVVEVQKWGVSIENFNPSEVDNEGNTFQERMGELVENLTGSNDIIEFHYGDKIVELLNDAQQESTDSIIKNLENLAKQNKDEELLKDVQKLNSQLDELKKAKNSAESESRSERDKRYQLDQKVEILERRQQILEDVADEENVDLISIEHHINQSTYRVDEIISDILLAIEQNAERQEIIELLNKISLENRKVSSLVNFVRKANFDTMSSKHSDDIIQYIEEYIRNIYSKDLKRKINKNLIDVDIDTNEKALKVEFVPLELNIILDNLLDNSKKAKASKAFINLSVENNCLEIDYSDNGIGIDPDIKDDIFEFGFTSTGGSGIGLYHIKKLIEENYNGSILATDSEDGANFKLNFNF
ncbi:ATP-binding protein [Gracilimonas sp.]|uniref:ATP-binding protein n=1 Tax=Gracilimonas sp. TaxID=1974203 RepID=UPI003D0C92E3